MNRIFLILLVNFFALNSFADARLDWGGDWDVLGAVNGETLSATGTISGATLILGASEIAINISPSPTHGYGLIYDATSNEITLQDIVATSTPDLALDDLSDVSALNPVLDGLLQWNGSVWSVTNEIDVKRLGGDVIGQATSTLYGDGSNLTNLPGGSLAFDDLTDVNAAAPPMNALAQWNGSIWSVTNEIDLARLSAHVIGRPTSTLYGDATNLTNVPAPSLALDDLTDVNTAGSSSGDVLGFNGASWVAQAAAGGASAWRIVAATDSPNKAAATYICDGTGDEAEINQSLNVNNYAILLPGSYAIAGKILCTSSNIAVIGLGEVNLNRRYNDASGTDCGLIHAYNSGAALTGLRLEGLNVIGNRHAYTSTNNVGIFLRNVDGVQIDRCRVLSEQDGIQNYAGCDSVIVRDTQLSTCGDDGLYSNTTGGLWYVEGCTITQNGGEGIYFLASYCHVRDSYIGYNAVDGFYSNSGDGHSLTGNRIEYNGDEGIEFNNNADNSLIAHNWINNNTGSGVWVGGALTRLLSNHIASNGTGLGGTYLESTQVKGNVFYANTGAAISCGLGNSSGTIVTGNQFINNGASGSTDCVYLGYNDNCVIAHNYFSDSAGTSDAIFIHANSSQVEIGFNTILGTWGSHINDGSTSTIYHQKADNALSAVIWEGRAANGTIWQASAAAVQQP